MSDYRNQLYSEYDTKFNKKINVVTDGDLKSQENHYKVKLLPYLNYFSRDSKILELGCGPGYLLDFLSKSGFKNLKGIDISSEQVNLARSKGYDVDEVDVMKFLQDQTQTWDIIFAFDFIEHFNKIEVIELFKMIHLKTADDGMIFFRTPNAEGLFPNGIIYGDLTHQTIFNKNSLSQLLNFSGFNYHLFFENHPINKTMMGVIRNVLWKVVRVLLNFVKLIESGQTQKLWTRELYCVAWKEFQKQDLSKK